MNFYVAAHKSGNVQIFLAVNVARGVVKKSAFQIDVHEVEFALVLFDIFVVAYLARLFLRFFWLFLFLGLFKQLFRYFKSDSRKLYALLKRRLDDYSEADVLNFDAIEIRVSFNCAICVSLPARTPTKSLSAFWAENLDFSAGKDSKFFNAFKT